MQKLRMLECGKTSIRKKLIDFVQGNDIHRGSKLNRIKEDGRRKTIYLKMKKKHFIQTEIITKMFTLNSNHFPAILKSSHII